MFGASLATQRAPLWVTRPSLRGQHARLSALETLSAGKLIHEPNMQTRSNMDPTVLRLKLCVDQAVYDVLEGRATVQLQGSSRKGTATQDSDWDFYVRHAGVLTQDQRTRIVDQAVSCMEQEGVHYQVQPGHNRVRLHNAHAPGLPAAVPDADIAFSNYKQRTKDEPHNKKMADAFMAQKVVQYIKLLPSYYTNLVKPRSMHLEDLVLRTQRCVDFADSCPAQKEGFDMLLHAILLVNARLPLWNAFNALLRDAHLDSPDWRHAADNVLKHKMTHGGWPWLYNDE